MHEICADTNASIESGGLKVQGALYLHLLFILLGGGRRGCSFDYSLYSFKCWTYFIIITFLIFYCEKFQTCGKVEGNLQ